MAKLTKTLLIVDDDQNARVLLRHLVEPEGFKVVEAQNGQEALLLLKENAVDMIVTDRDMPGMDGMTLLKHLHEQYPALPALMISAYGEESLWGQALRLGAKDYLVKPFKKEEVLGQIRKYLPGSKR